MGKYSQDQHKDGCKKDVRSGYDKIVLVYKSVPILLVSHKALQAPCNAIEQNPMQCNTI